MVDTGETFADMIAHDPRRAIDSAIADIIVGSGRGTGRVTIVPEEEREY